MTSSGLDYCLTSMLTPLGACWQQNAPLTFAQRNHLIPKQCVKDYLLDPAYF